MMFFFLSRLLDDFAREQIASVFIVQARARLLHHMNGRLEEVPEDG